jgi:hypothetical protein
MHWRELLVNLTWTQSELKWKSEVKLILQRMVNWPVHLGVRHHFRGLWPDFSVSFQLSENCFLLLTGGLSLMRALVCSLQWNCSMVCHAWPITISSETPPTWKTMSPYLYSPGTWCPSYTPRHWVPFLSPVTFNRDYGGNALTLLHTNQ